MISVRRLLGAAIALTVVMAGLAHAETQYRGRAGASYDVQDFRGGVTEAANEPVLKQFFRHSIKFDALGDIKGQKYGSWTLGLSLDGYYDRSTMLNSDGAPQAVDTYYSPDLKNLRGSLSLLPTSRVPAYTYYTGRHFFAVEYDEKNRYVVTTERPILAVLRKYETERKDFGGNVSWLTRPGLKFRAAYEGSRQKVMRRYDFDENRDIHSIIQPGQPGSLSEYYVFFTNQLPESLTVFMEDTLLIPDLGPGEHLGVRIPAGRYRFDIRTRSFNPYTTTQTINSTISWTVKYIPPATPNDRDVTADALHFQGLYENGLKLRNEARLDLENQNDGVMGTKGKNLTFNNTMLYKASDRSAVQTLTNYSELTSENAGQPQETQSSLNHLTTLNYDMDSRTSLNLSHNFTTMLNRGLRTYINNVEANATRKFNYRYSTDLQLSGGKLTDNRDFNRDNVGVRTRHQYRGVRLWRIETTLSEQLDIRASTEQNPGRFQTEYDNRFKFDNDLGRLGRFGEVAVAYEIGTRWFNDQSGDITEQKRTVGLTISNREWRRLRLTAFVTRESSHTTGTGSQAGRRFRSLNGKLAANVLLGNGAHATGSVMLIDQDEVGIQRYLFGMAWVWPKIPVRHSIDYQEEHKNYTISDEKELFQTFGQRASIKWRSIDFSVEHNIVFERVRLGASRYQDFRFNLERGFDI